MISTDGKQVFELGFRERYHEILVHPQDTSKELLSELTQLCFSKCVARWVERKSSGLQCIESPS